MDYKCWNNKFTAMSEEYCRDILSNGVDYYYSMSSNHCYYN